MASAQLLTLLISFAALPIVIHFIGLSLYGVWVIIFGLVTMLAIFDLGLGGTFVTQLSMALARDDKRQVRQFLTLSVLFYLLLGALFSPLLYFVVPLLPSWLHIAPRFWHSVEPLIPWLYGFVFLSQAFSAFTSLAAADQRFALVAVLGVLGQLTNSGSLIFLLIFHVGLPAFIIALYASWVIPTLVYVILSFRILKEWPFTVLWPFPRQLMAQLASFSGWLQINRISNQITNEIDRVLIGIYVSPAAAGVFQIAYRLTRIAKTFPGSLTGTILPVISHWEATDNHDHIRHTFRDATRYLVALTLFFGVFFWSCERIIFHFWLAHHYPGEFIAMALLTITVVVNSLTAIGTTILRGIGKPRLESYYAILNAFLKILISLSLASRFKLPGILLGTVLGTVLGSFYFLWLFFRRMNINWKDGLWSWIWPIVMTATASGVITNVLTHRIALPPGRASSLILSAAFGVFYTIIFAYGLHLFGFYQESRDIERLKQILPHSLLIIGQRLHIFPRLSHVGNI